MGVDLFVECARLSIAARHQTTIAELCEAVGQDRAQLEKSMAAYEKAAEWHEADDASGQVDVPCSC